MFLPLCDLSINFSLIKVHWEDRWIVALILQKLDILLHKGYLLLHSLFLRIAALGSLLVNLRRNVVDLISHLLILRLPLQIVTVEF